MRKNITKVINAFQKKKSIVGDKRRTCSTDGEKIYSYRMVIAERVNDEIFIADVEASPSVTTTQQINACHFMLSGTTVPADEWLQKHPHRW